MLLINFQPENITITNQSLVLKTLDDVFNDYRILQVSDFHLGTWINTRDMYALVDLINHQEPDLIAITGDFISSDPEKYSKVLYNTLSGLSSKDGVVAVLGNHDHYTDSEQIRDALNNCGIIELNNSIHVIDRSSSQLIMAGIDDYMTRHADLNKVINQIPNSDDPVILLAHEPDFADISSESGRFALQLSGHTHGGQICLPLYGNLYLPRYGRKYPSGYYRVNDMHLYTNRGIGTSWLKFRLNCPPEITIFELTNLDG